MSGPIKYTREMLAELAAQSTSINDMMRRLGVPMAGGTHSYRSRRLKFYGVDTSHFNAGRPDHGRARYTKELLQEAVANSDNIGSMLQYMGVDPYGSVNWYLRKRLIDFNIDTSHFSPTEKKRFHGLIPVDILTLISASRSSISAVVRALDMPENGSARRLVQKSMPAHNIDTSHFTGRAHSRGRNLPSRRQPEDILVRLAPLSKRIPGERLRKALIHIGCPNICEMCGSPPEWLGYPMVLEVDHIDGDWLNNTAENLRLLCPNCHSITPTYCGRNKQGTSQAPCSTSFTRHQPS